MAAEAEHGENDQGVGDVKPKAMRVMSRILVFMDSTRPLADPTKPWRARRAVLG